MKKFRKIIALLLCLTFAMSFSAMAVAPEEGLQPYSSFEFRKTTAVASSSGSTLSINFDVKASDTCSKIGINSITVYDSTNKTSFTAAGTTTSGTDQYSNTVYIPITQGHVYYAIVQFVAQPSGGSAVYKSVFTNTIQT